MLPPKPPMMVNDNKNTPSTKICSNIDEDSMSSGKRAGPSASGGKRSSWDFPPPEFDIMGSLEEPTPLGEGTSSSHQNQGRHTPHAMLNKNNIELGTYPPHYLLFFIICFFVFFLHARQLCLPHLGKIINPSWHFDQPKLLFQSVKVNQTIFCSPLPNRWCIPIDIGWCIT